MNGAMVVVVIADTEGELRLLGLPEGKYQAHFTTAAETQVESQIRFEGKELVTSIPDKGVITIHQVNLPLAEKTEVIMSQPAPETIQTNQNEPGEAPVITITPFSPTPISNPETMVNFLPREDQWKFLIGGLFFFAAVILVSTLIVRHGKH